MGLTDMRLGSRPDTALIPYGLLGTNPSFSVLQSGDGFSSPHHPIWQHMAQMGGGWALDFRMALQCLPFRCKRDSSQTSGFLTFLTLFSAILTVGCFVVISKHSDLHEGLN